MRKQLHPYSYFNSRRASAIIGALVITGIVALAVGIMLSTTTTAIRRSADRLTYEEAYQAALAGTHVARAWLVDPTLVGTMAGNFTGGGNASTTQAGIQNLVDRATVMNETLVADIAAKLLAKAPLTNMNLYGTSRYAMAGLTPTGSLSGGRKLLYQIPSSPLVTFINDAGQPKFGKNLFKAAPAGGHKNYVEWVRITTPGTDAETSASLRETTFIVEAKGVSEYAGVKKERVVQQRILIKPVKAADPLLGATEAIITDNTVSVKGNSSANVHWGPVLAKGDLNLDFLKAIEKTGSGLTAKYTLGLNQSQKANIAGLGIGESGNNSAFDGILDKHLQWKTGTQGYLMAGANGNKNESMFKNLTGVPTTNFDFFQELAKGTFGGVPATMVGKLVLDSNFGTVGTSVANPQGLFDPITYKGALVQGSVEVDTRVDEFFNGMNYDKLKTYAKAHNAYYTYDGSTLKNEAGQVVPKPTMSLNATDPLATTAASDRMLFVDSAAGSETNPFNTDFEMPSFWKGVVYANGPIKFSGQGGTDVIMRSPEQFKSYRDGAGTTGQTGKKVWVDGIVISNGTADIDQGGGAIYGTLAAKGGIITGANFSIFYNAANGEGRLKDTATGSQPYTLISGKLYETKVPSI